VIAVGDSIVCIMGFPPCHAASRAAGHWFSSTYEPEHRAETAYSALFPANFRPNSTLQQTSCMGGGSAARTSYQGDRRRRRQVCPTIRRDLQDSAGLRAYGANLGDCRSKTMTSCPSLWNIGARIAQLGLCRWESRSSYRRRLSSYVDKAFPELRARHQTAFGSPEDPVAISGDQVVPKIQQSVWEHPKNP
jgi:hypothetical protein